MFGEQRRSPGKGETDKNRTLRCLRYRCIGCSRMACCDGPRFDGVIGRSEVALQRTDQAVGMLFEVIMVMKRPKQRRRKQQGRKNFTDIPVFHGTIIL